MNHHETPPPKPRALERARAGSAAIAIVLGAIAAPGVLATGCGSPSEGDDESVELPVFGSMNPGNPSGGGSAGASACVGPNCGTQTCVGAACGGGTPEGMNPGTPIDPNTPNPPGTMPPVAQACTPNQVFCTGNVLNTCDATGTQVTPRDCAADGGTCGMGPSGVACLTQSQACTPGQVTCEGANTIATCSADGSSVNVTRCPNGTNCTNGTCTPVRCNDAGMLSHNGDGGVTVYWFAQGTIDVPREPDQDVHCGFNGTRANNDDGGQNDRVAYIQDPALFGAMNLAEYNTAASCGACVQMNLGGRSVTITVADSCNPGINNNGTCTPGHIDLSRSAFQQLTGQSTGDINGVSWRFVPCDSVGNVQFLLKKPDDQYWNEFLVVNHKYPIKRAQVLMEDGRWVDAQRMDYNYWHPPEGNNGDGGDMGTYRVRVTDINDGVIEEQLELRGGLQGGTAQFECQP